MRSGPFTIALSFLVAGTCGASLVAGPQGESGSRLLDGDDAAQVFVGGPGASGLSDSSFLRSGSQVPGPGNHPAAIAVPGVMSTPPPAVTPSPESASATSTSANVYANTVGPALSPAVQGIPSRAYVPNSGAGTVTVIDTATFEVIDRLEVGRVPHHVTPSWDLTKLFVNNTEGDTLTVIDPRSGKPVDTLKIIDPYNLYFTPDGTKAIVVAERYERLDFYDRVTWQPLKSVPIPWSGVDHGDFTADGRYFLASTEFSGKVVKVDTQAMELVGVAEVGSLPIDVKISPDGAVAYVTNQGRHGVSVLDPVAMTEIGFLPTGRGAHGLNISRDTRSLFVSNRLEGTISVIDLATRTVRTTWRVGGSPDMIQITADGTQLWVSNRFHASVSVVDTTTGALIRTIPAEAGAHGVSLFPQPGRYSVGHNGVYR